MPSSFADVLARFHAPVDPSDDMLTRGQGVQDYDLQGGEALSSPPPASSISGPSEPVGSRASPSDDSISSILERFGDKPNKNQGMDEEQKQKEKNDIAKLLSDLEKAQAEDKHHGHLRRMQ